MGQYMRVFYDISVQRAQLAHNSGSPMVRKPYAISMVYCWRAFGGLMMYTIWDSQSMRLVLIPATSPATTQQWVTNGQKTIRHFNGVLLAGLWWSDDVYYLGQPVHESTYNISVRQAQLAHNRGHPKTRQQ